ncbi:tyrosine-type recombinase/integrase [Methanobacterium sp.]|uniref:tyrosine-type recombinase/integrase n=1 Tax=Methanobacterium sp. TaxID=2164 RepID=UPI0025E8A646|nr:tyrosine-type recombinase/integrase [Methanobacterium sp.]MBI5458944.1 site-specific integrase [Methanobacterium sp.]
MKGEDDEIIENWFLRRNIAKGTQKSYSIAFKDYCDLIGKTPSELFEEADLEEERGVRPIKSKVYHYLLKYKKHLIESGKSKKTVKLYFSTVRSFYMSFDITLPDIKLDSGDIGLEKNEGRLLKRADIRKLVNAASSRERALIYLMALSGMGQQEARDLTIKKYLDVASSAIGKPLDDVNDLFKFEDEILKEILTLHITRQKTRYSHITFIPPEASREIIHYLKERCNGRNEKVRVDNNSDYIFASKNGGQLSRDSIVTNFRRIGELAGFKRDKNSYSFWRSHALRKYFISTFINKKGEKVIADFMAGHKISDMDRAYWKANPEDLKKMYADALPTLSLDKANVRDYETEEFREIKEKNKDLNEKLKMQNEEMAQLKDQIKSVQDDTQKSFKELLENLNPSDPNAIAKLLPILSSSAFEDKNIVKTQYRKNTD